MTESSVTVIVMELDPDVFGGYSPGVARPFYAYLAANPQIRASGDSEEDALARLKNVVLRNGPKARRRRVVDMRLDELIVEEVMEEAVYDGDP